MELNNNLPPRGTPEYDEMMRQYYGPDYELGFRVGFGPRFAAFVLDLLIYLILATTIFVATGWMSEIISELGSYSNPVEIMQAIEHNEALVSIVNKFEIVIILLTIFYYSTEIFFAGSPGKKILGLVIADANMSQANMQKLLTRFIVKHSSTMLSLLGLIIQSVFFEFFQSLIAFAVLLGYLLVLGYKKQAIQDMAAQTAVYKIEDIKIN